MMSDLFIGLCGKKGSGKSYVAENMRDTRGAKIIRFADTLKDMMRVMGFNEPSQCSALHADWGWRRHHAFSEGL